MSEALPLDKKYRPANLDEVIGNTSTVQAIARLIERGSDFPSCVLLYGPSGCGKTTLARIIAQSLGATARDYKEFNISNMRGIDTAREIERVTYIAPLGKCRVITLDECHAATRDFQNAMLKVLEEPPSGNYFILCTTEPDRLLGTIKTRAEKFQVGLLNRGELDSILQYVVDEEGLSISDECITRIIGAADGCPRQALTMLDAVRDLDADSAESVIQGYVGIPEQTIADLCQALLRHKPWKEVAGIIKTFDKEEAERARNQLLAYFEKVLLSRGAAAVGIAEMMDFFATPLYASGRPGFTQACLFAWMSQEKKR